MIFGPDVSLRKPKTPERKKYHTVMRKPKVNVARGRREWNKLTREEQQLAIDRIEDVYYHTNDTRFIAHASTYLKDKAFLNEYMD